VSDTATPVVAAFDLDGTLTEGGSVFAWLRFIAGRSTANRVAFRLAFPLVAGAIRSGESADKAKERLFHALLACRDVAEVTTQSSLFAIEHLESHLRERVAARLAWHLEQGHDVVIVSASPQIYVDVMAAEVKAHGALGTRLAVDARDKFTGSYLGKNCRGTEKMRRLQEWIDERGYSSPPEIYAYGNSRGDRRLLRGAAHPFAAGRLGRLGSLRRFPRLPKNPPSDATAGESKD
jgi:phosphatidylglycerophosphatase C